MAGNVQEWTRDWFDSKYYNLLAKTGADNPTGPGSELTAVSDAATFRSRRLEDLVGDGPRRSTR